MRLVNWFYIFLVATAQQAHSQTVCIGDSVTQGAPYVEQSYCDMVGGINAGTGGNKASQGLERFKSDVLIHKPKIIVIMFGINDGYRQVPPLEFRNTILRMIKLSKKRKVILMTPNPWIAGDPFYSREVLNKDLLALANVIRIIARRKHLPLVDNYKTFAELALYDDIFKYYKDAAVHPNSLGHEIIASSLMEHLKDK